MSIRYVNQYDRCSDKYIIIKIPAYITSSQFDSLNKLLEDCMKKYRVLVKILLKGRDDLSQKYFDLKVNNHINDR